MLTKEQYDALVVEHKALGEAYDALWNQTHKILPGGYILVNRTTAQSARLDRLAEQMKAVYAQIKGYRDDCKLAVDPPIKFKGNNQG
jgi:hypothetical protein